MMGKEPDPMSLLMVDTRRTEHSGDCSSELTREESLRSIVPYDESETTLEEKSMRKLPTAFARTLSSIPSFEQSKRLSEQADTHLKVVVIGDNSVGKTCLLKTYVQREFPTSDVPEVFENYSTKIVGPKNKVIELALWDTAGKKEFNRYRPLSYSGVDVVIVCYAVNDRKSLSNVKDVWIPEVKHFCPEAPIMLLGLKSDLNVKSTIMKSSANKIHNSIGESVNLDIAETICKQSGAFAHVQCSSKTSSNIDEVFNLVFNIGLYDVLYGPKEIPPILKNPFKKGMNHKKSSVDLKIEVKKNNDKGKQKCIIL